MMPPQPRSERLPEYSCPYPECPGTFPQEEAVEETLVCRSCSRLVTRCPHGGANRCTALNRVLAHHCRHCGRVLESDWARTLWTRDLFVRSTETSPVRPTSLRVSEPDTVLSLTGLVHLGENQSTPPALVEAAGRLWLGLPDGRCLFIDPFPGTRRDIPIPSRPLWSLPSPNAQLYLRAQAVGQWLVVYESLELKAFNLLWLDAARRADPPPFDIWSASQGQSMASDPVLLPAAKEGLEGLSCQIAWVIANGSALSLGLTVLAAEASHRPDVSVVALVQPNGAHVQLPAADQRVVLVHAPLGSQEGLVLCTEQDLYWIPWPSRGGSTTATVVPLLHRPRFVINWNELPGVLFVPSSTGSAGRATTPMGQVFVAYQDAALKAQRMLCDVYATAQGCSNKPIDSAKPGGIPVSVLTEGREVRILYLADSRLMVRSLLLQDSEIGESAKLPGVVRCHGEGRLGICSGTAVVHGRPRWFAQLWDLRGRQLVYQADLLDEPVPHPVVIGPYWFAFEKTAAGMALVRRRILTTSPDSAPTEKQEIYELVDS